MKAFQNEKIYNDNFYVSHLTPIVEITQYIIILKEIFRTIEIEENDNVDYT